MQRLDDGLPADAVRFAGDPAPRIRVYRMDDNEWWAGESLAAFDPSTRYCTMNCGPHRDDPRTNAERKLLCGDCVEDWNR